MSVAARLLSVGNQDAVGLAVADGGLIRITDGTCTIAPDAGDLSAMSSPDTLQGVVAARIDRLAPSQELVLKVASVIGRLFAFRLLRDIHPIEADRSALQGFLDDLQRQDFTVLDTPAPDLAPPAIREGISDRPATRIVVSRPERTPLRPPSTCLGGLAQGPGRGRATGHDLRTRPGALPDRPPSAPKAIQHDGHT
jgi:hypothetical protein